MADNNVVGGVDENSVRFIHHLIRNSRRRRLMMQLTVHYLFARRRRLLSVCLISLLMLLSQRRVITQLPRRRSCRRLVRSTGWWENVWNNYSEARFKKTFRISRATFRYILDRIEPILARQTLTEDLISPDERLAICLYQLGRGDYYYTIAELVGRGVSTVSSIVEEVSQVLVNHLWNDCFNTLASFNRSFQRKNSRHARALAIPLLLGSNRRLPYPNKVPSRRIRILQRVPQLQKFLLYCLNGHG